MKRTALILGMIILISGLTISTALANKTIEAPIKAVTVYPDRAQITRLGHFIYPVGEYSFLIENIPNRAIDESFRASVSDIKGLTLLGLNHRVVHLTQAPQEKVAELEKLIHDIEQYEKREKTDRLEIFDEQKRLIMTLSQTANQWTTNDSDEVKIDVKLWSDAYGFIGGNLRSIKDSIRIVSFELEEIENRLTQLRAMLNSMLNSTLSEKQRSTKTVQIDVILDRACEFDLALKYVIPGASWTPIYDARLNGETEDVNLNCFAEIAQSTGEDWNDVALTISTAMPSQGTGPGLFAPWFLAVREYISSGQVKMTKDEIKAMPVTDVNQLLKQTAGVITNAEGEIIIRGGRAGNETYVVGTPALINNHNYSITFKAKHTKTVPSGQESVRTLIASWDMESDITYISRPRNRQEVYRLATIINQEQAPLMPGKVSIFADSDFLGTTHIVGFIAPGQEFELPFGVDNNLNIKREMLAVKKSQSNQLIGTDKMKLEQTVQITLKNNGQTDRVITLEEPLPVSQDKRIKVKIGDVSPKTSLDDIQGKAEWSIALKPGEEKKVTIPYKIECPVDVHIAGL